MTTMRRRDALLTLIGLTAAARAVPCIAQQRKVARVGFLALGSASDHAPVAKAFMKGMADLGYIDGRNLIMEWRFADGNFERLPALAASLVQAKVDVIVAQASAAIGAAQKATTTIPIVMATTGDPVGSGFVQSLAKPGGNITGLSNMGGDIGGKLFDLLHSVLPRMTRVAVLVTPTSTTYRAIRDTVEAAAKAAGVTTFVVEVSTPQEMDGAFAAIERDKAGAVIVGAAPLFALQRERIAELALKYRLPSVFGNRAYVEAGGLMGYGTPLTANYVRAAAYVDKILKGAKPADLPVEQPRTLELVVNMKTARALGLAIPQTILLTADVIE